MESSSPTATAIPPHPGPPISGCPTSPTSSISPSSSESEQERRRRTRAERPKLGSRVSSKSIIIPKGKETLQPSTEYPPDDARAMSPRRNLADLERLGEEARRALKNEARSLQSALRDLAERIDEVKSDHDKLESENRFLQDYIGGLTRTMSRGELQSTLGARSRRG